MRCVRTSSAVSHLSRLSLILERAKISRRVCLTKVRRVDSLDVREFVHLLAIKYMHSEATGATFKG